MGHEICALVVADPLDVEQAAKVDLRVRLEHPPVVVLPIDHFYSAYWGAVRGAGERLDLPDDVPGIFPSQVVLADLVSEITGRPEPRFAIIQTDYFGSAGLQWAVLFRGRARETARISIDDALEALGVRAQPPLDAFDTIGLGKFRENPEYLERYWDLCDELGV